MILVDIDLRPRREHETVRPCIRCSGDNDVTVVMSGPALRRDVATNWCAGCLPDLEVIRIFVNLRLAAAYLRPLYLAYAGEDEPCTKAG